MKSKTVKIILVIGGLLIISQLIPVDHSNPPVVAKIKVPEQVETIFKRSCNDCHSNETIWPWYSNVAPVSWLVAHDVEEGREHLNFSTWGTLPENKQQKLRKEIWETISEDEMPPLVYLPAHPDARLNDKDKRDIRNWLSK